MLEPAILVLGLQPVIVEPEEVLVGGRQVADRRHDHVSGVLHGCDGCEQDLPGHHLVEGEVDGLLPVAAEATRHDDLDGLGRPVDPVLRRVVAETGVHRHLVEGQDHVLLDVREGPTQAAHDLQR